MRNLLAVCLFVAVGWATWLASGSAAPKPKDPEADLDALAKQATEQFLKALVAKDIDAVMAVVDVPYFLDFLRGSTKDRDALRAEFVETFKEKDYAGIQFTVVEAVTYADFVPKLAKHKELKEALDTVVGPKDRVVAIIDSADKKQEKEYLAVRIFGGKAKVVGIFH
jgi:hypothetical protein